MVSTLAHLLLEQGCEDFTFVDQVFDELEHVLDSLFMHSIEIAELDSYFDQADAFDS